MIGVRFALYLALSVSFGLSAFGLYGLRATERDALALRPWLLSGTTLGLLLSAATLVLLASTMAGAPVWPIDTAAIGALLDQPGVGTAWKARMVSLTLASVAAMLGAGRTLGLGAVALASGVGLATLAWAGHGAMDDGPLGWVHVVADVLHLLAAAMWIGALLGLVLLVTRPLSMVDATHLGLTHRALHGFGAIGSVVVATIVVTGLVNAWLLVGLGHLTALGASFYVRLLIAKLALFAAMLGFASLNRFRLTPALEARIAARDHGRALRALRASLAAETACVIVILALVAWLGTLEPPASAG